jgi:phosphoglycerate dehydrogenase-like enzyme
MEKKTVEVQKEEATIVEPKTPIKERIMNSRPVKFVKRHKAGVIAGVAATAAAGTAAVLAARGAFDAAGDAPFDIDTVTDSLPIEEE